MSDRSRETINIPGRPMRFGGHNRFMPGEKSKDPKGTFRKLLKFYLLEGRMLLLVLGLLIIQTTIGVAIPFLVGRSVDAMTGTVDFDLVFIFVLMFLIAIIISWLIDISQGVVMNFTTQRIVRKMRKSLFDKYQTLPLKYHDAHSYGELMSRMTNDVDNISQTIASSTTSLISAVITLLGSIAVMLYLNVWMTLTALIIIPLVYILTKITASRSRKMFRVQQKELGTLNAIIEEMISGQKIVKAFNMEDKVIDKFANVNGQLRIASTSALIWAGLLMPMLNAISNFGYLSVAIHGSILVANNVISVGIVASFIIYSRQFVHPLNNLAGIFTNLQSALAGAERVFEVLAEDDETADSPNAVEMSDPKGDVKFDNVTFAYSEGVNVLHDISFEAKAGMKIALVGETGAGKTTIVNLLSRFYDVSGGAIYIDGIDIREYKRDSLREAFSIVLQDTCLFTGTIIDNIRYGRPEATYDEVVEAAKAGGAHEFIVRLRDGYNTVVSGDSETLSQGQRQLLAISRAVLCSAPILILDEATSSVDTKTELRIQAAMAELARGSTCFVIAHRLSTIRDADRILVLQEGEIIEEGTHDELISLSGLYAQMYERS